MKDLVSIIVPIYNIEKYLIRCIESILAQTYKNIEIILVDDQSIDKSTEICDSYAKLDNRIKVIHKLNGGVADARNVGITTATGKYLVFIDGDDYVNKDMVEKLYNAVEVNDADIAICNYEYVNENGEIISSINRKVFENNLNEILIDEVIYWKNYNDYDKIYYVVLWNKIYKREVFGDLKFPKGKIHEDEAILHRLLNRCEKIVCLNEKMYNYVQRHGSIMNRKMSIKSLSYIETIINRINYLCKKEINNYNGAIFTTGVIRLLDYRNDNIAINEKYYIYQRKMKEEAKYLLFAKKQRLTTRIKMIIFLSGGTKLYQICLKIFAKIKLNKGQGK